MTRVEPSAIWRVMAISSLDELKRKAAESALTHLRDGMVLGLGSGTTVAFFLEALARKVAAGLRIVGIPSSEQTATDARRLGIRLTDFAAHRRIDLTVDGADQIERGSLSLVKGLGGALLREKLIASASARMIVIADETKLVERLGNRTPVPVEIVPFAAPLTLDRLTALGAKPQLRCRGDATVITDNGNYLADCHFDTIADPAALDRALKAILGVVATGLFVGLASEAIIAGGDGIKILTPDR